MYVEAFRTTDFSLIFDVQGMDRDLFRLYF